MAETSFVELIERLQNNDQEAIGLIVQRYGRRLRRAIDRAIFERHLATGPSRRGDREGSDIFQTVLLVFLARLERGRHSPSSGPGAELSFETPGHLVAYLKAIAGNEIKRVQRRGRVASESENRHDQAGGAGRGGRIASEPGLARGVARADAQPEAHHTRAAGAGSGSPGRDRTETATRREGNLGPGSSGAELGRGCRATEWLGRGVTENVLAGDPADCE